MNGRGQQAENGSSLKIERWTHSFSLGVQQTRTLSRPIWSATLLVSIISNARSGGKPFAHRERPSPVHKVTFKQRRNRTRKKKKQIWRFFCWVLATKSATATWSKKRKGFLSKTRNSFARESLFSSLFSVARKRYQHEGNHRSVPFAYPTLLEVPRNAL